MLKKIKPVNLDVLSTFLERNTPLPIYHKLVNTITGTIYKSIKQVTNYNSNLYCIYDFPNYLKGHINKKGWKAKNIDTYKGSLILLKEYNNTEDYLKHKFSNGRRSKFRTYKKRLETCFNIEYKTYFGEIAKDEYESLFEAFHEMTRKRFLEKKLQNYDLSRWNVYHEIAYPLINNKEAVLFVIFNNKKPISICLNFVRNKTIYGYLRTYDIDYSKFYIGFTDFINQLHWCYDNKIEVFDLLKGSYPYKMQLIDMQYNFQMHVVYNTNSLLTIISANIIIAKTKSFYFLVKVLKKLNANVLYYKFINYKYQNKELSKIEDEHQNIIINNDVKTTLPEEFEEINLSNESFSFLKRFIYNFLYANQDSINNIKLFKYKNEVKSFLIKGEKNAQKITFQ